MTPSTRRLLTLVLLVVLAGGSAWWALFIPYQPRQIYRGIPGGASVVVTVDRLAGRWDGILGNPAGASLLTVLGIDPKALRDPAIQPLLNLFANDLTVAAFVPELGFMAEPAWVFSSWMGGKATALRWSKKVILRAGLTPLPSHSGWPVWMLEAPLDETGTRLSFALADGVAVGVLSRDPLAIEEALAAYNGTYPSVFFRRDLDPLVDEALASDLLDRGWLIPRLLGLAGVWPPSLSFGLALDRTDALHGTVRYEMDPMPELAMAPDAWSPVLPWVADASVAHAVATPTLADAWLRRSVPYPWMAPFRSLILAGNNPVRAACAGLLDDEFSGRLKGIKIPTLLVGVRLHDGVAAGELFADLIDRVNIHYRWQLVPRYEEAGGVTVAVLEGGSSSAYTLLGRQEYPAVAILDGWLVLGSNAQGLKKWLAVADLGTAQDVAVEADAAPGRLLGAQFDLASAGKAVRLALSAWSLKLLVEDPLNSGPAREKINEIKAWIDTLAPLETLALTLDQSEGYAVYAVTAGTGPAEGESEP